MTEDKISSKNIGVDGVGVGASTVNKLKELGISKTDIDLQSGSAPVETDDTEQFNNLRSQMCWQLRTDLKSGELAFAYNEKLFAEMVIPKWNIKGGKIAVESKEEIKKRLGHSPNLFDAMVYWNWRRTVKKHKHKFAMA
jgi:hypothetical protein